MDLADKGANQEVLSTSVLANLNEAAALLL